MLAITSKDNIVQFAEVEYRPRDKSPQIGVRFQPPQAGGYWRDMHMPAMHLDESRSMELAQFTREHNVLSKPPRQFVARTEVEDATTYV